MTSSVMPLTRAAHTGARTPTRQIRLAALRVPLGMKLVGANLLVVAMMLGVSLSASSVALRERMIEVAALAICVQLVLVFVALGPIRDLESAVSRVWRGDFRARVERSSLADDDVLRVGSMFNILLDGLNADRARMQTLAAEVIAVGERERAALARELHESTAQDIAALMLQLSAAARDTEDPDLADRLLEANESARQILEHVRALSQSVHSGVLDDLGIESALRKLAREMSHGNGIDIDVSVEDSARRLPRKIEAALYRVAHEAVRNATIHAAPKHVRVALDLRGADAILEIHDDGTGFDLAQAEARGPAMGLLCMRERVALVDGSLDIRTAKGNGTTISATVPLDAARQSEHLENT